MRSALVAIALLWPLWAQTSAKPTEKAPLANNGQPIIVPFQCTNEDIDWAGMTCSEEEPCPVYLELAAVESVGNRIFLAGNIHSSSVTLYSVLLASDDAGKSWQEPYDRMRGMVLDHIQFIDFEMGWVSGQSLQPVAQDPFLLITSDGGKMWRKRPIFSEGRAGTISQFWFSSRTSGTLLIDRSQSGEEGRYELYESMTGGESWMLREVNEKPIRLKRLAPAETDWRIRPDAGSKSFHIEKRQNEKWTPLARFLVPIGACKPMEPAITEEPAAPVTQPSTAQTPVTPPRQPPSLKRRPRQ
jgi:hypothetical protein